MTLLPEIKEKYLKWCSSQEFDTETSQELLAITDPAEITDRFYTDLSFGTAGLRGLIGAGTNRMNVYTVRRATQGLANYLQQCGEQALNKGVVIAYDTRLYSDRFALEAALMLCAKGIKTYLFKGPRPVPELSFAVRYLQTQAGIVITASHNPAAYNGYKVYWENGAQILGEVAAQISQAIALIPDYTCTYNLTVDQAQAKGLLTMIDTELDHSYAKAVLAQMYHSKLSQQQGQTIKIIYTPLHGTGQVFVPTLLEELGYKVEVVAEQKDPDPQFSTVHVPNPEQEDAFDLALKLAQQQQADLILATDPDADRVGVAVRSTQGKYYMLNGNQIGALLLDYILSQLKRQNSLPQNPIMIKTIVSTDLARSIAEHFGVQCKEVLTGFKYIGQQLEEMTQKKIGTFILGFEESYGYLVGDYARDKDGIVTCLLISEMVLYYQQQGLNLLQVLERLYQQHGYYQEKTISFKLTGISGQQQMQAILHNLRTNPPAKIGTQKVTIIQDYLTQINTEKTLPQANVLTFNLENNSKVIIRPSGTEPKIKAYIMVRGANKKATERQLNTLEQAVKSLLFPNA